MNVLLTGGVGYIGSHTAVVLLEAGHQVFLYDNLCNSKADVVTRLAKICGQELAFSQADIRDTALLARALRDWRIDAVLHFAGLKAVGESSEKPLEYYDNNIGGTISLLQAMRQTSVRQLVFSSSATVYGIPQYLPFDEAHPVNATNPYGRNKLHIEEMLCDVTQSDAGWSVVCLRYFNPVGAHGSGLIGEDPGEPNNLMPYIARVAAGLLPELKVYGDDYPTADGTGIRDYIHVLDLAEGHLAALKHLSASADQFAIFNLGTGRGHSVLEMRQAFEQACGHSIPYKVVGRRAGDVASCYAEASKAAVELGWRARRNLQDMCESAWNFQSRRQTNNTH